MSDLRRAILRASLEVIEQRGVAALSVREVARAAGVSHQAPYKHFADREALLATLVAEGFDGLAEATSSARVGDPREDVLAAGRAYVRWAVANPGAYRLLFRPDVVPLDHPLAGPAAARAFAVLDGLARGLVDAGAVAVEEREAFLAMLWSTVHGLASLLLDGPLPTKGATLRGEALIDAVVAQVGARLRADGDT